MKKALFILTLLLIFIHKTNSQDMDSLLMSLDPTFDEPTSEKKNNGLVVDGEIPVSLEAFKVERPSFMLVKTDDNIKISFHLEFYP